MVWVQMQIGLILTPLGSLRLVPAEVMDGSESSESWETSLKGVDRRLSFTFAIGTNGGTWPLKRHLFKHLAHCGSAVSSLANPSHNTVWHVTVKGTCSLFMSGPSLIVLLLQNKHFLSMNVLFHVPQRLIQTTLSHFPLKVQAARLLPQWSPHKGCISQNR